LKEKVRAMLTMRQLGPLFFVAALGISQAEPNLVVNGGFEAGDFTGWTESGDLSPCLFVGTIGDEGSDGSCFPATAIAPQSGNFAAFLGNNDADAFLSQNIVTNTPNSTYTISFWLASQSAVPPTDFYVYWGSQMLTYMGNLPQFGWRQYMFAGLTAAGPTTTLEFGFRDDATYIALDNISVVDPVVPEPSALIPAALLLAFLGSRLYWQRTVAAHA
jgi:hypothetical protein